MNGDTQVLRLAAWADCLAPLGAVEKSEARVVDLQIGAAQLGEPGNLGSVGGSNISEEFFQIGVRLAIKAAPAGVVHHAWRRDCQFCSLPGCAFEERKAIAVDHVLEFDLAV